MLTVHAGPDVGKSCALDLHRVSVGQASDNELVLTDPQVSRRHLEFQVHDQGYLVRDLKSTNGTYYQGARILEVLVSPGAELRLGSTVLRVVAQSERSEPVARRQALGTLIGSSAPMQEVYGLIAAVAPTDVTVLIEGETGTGKELVAEELHRHSSRARHAFSVVDCGALPPTLIESELFGHERGAFTGASSERAGIFEKSRGGTVFLDELGELPLDVQTRLLRVLDRRQIRRVGGDAVRKVDVRIVAATNRDLREEVRQGRFRQDLYFRLSVVRINVPPLRKRLEDLPLLAEHFLWQMGCVNPPEVLTPEVLKVLLSRKWPGNVRELRNVVERSVVLADEAPFQVDSAQLSATSEEEGLTDEERGAAHRPVTTPSGAANWLAPAVPAGFLDQPYKGAKESLLQLFEELYLSRLYERYGHNISRIARDAGVDRQLVRRLLRKHGLPEEP
ncbi:MAG: sigma 54-dependent Fis family transcriptional regulator [Deltaproteobacteria bacterium]|nr:sigma 54-dependent Fis family transcriptional regulator [Deltaproteobacteria bacterium]